MMTTTATQETVWTMATITARLATSSKFVERSLLKLYERQTHDEQASGRTVEHNGRGFTGIDAELLTSFAQQVLRNKHGRPEGQRLSDKQMALARRKLPKYWKQLLEEAAANGCAVSMKVPRAPRRRPSPVAMQNAADVEAAGFDAAIAARDREDARRAADAKLVRQTLTPRTGEAAEPSETRMYAYTNEHTEVWDVAEGATIDEVREAVAAMRQSSWGALRWMTYELVALRTPTEAVIRHVEHLCD